MAQGKKPKTARGRQKKSPRPAERVEPRILFVEAEAWEHGELVHSCQHDCDVHVRSQRLEEIPESDVPADITILSPFIHSRIDRTQLARLKNLKFIATRSTGVDHIDLEACRRRGIIVSNVPQYGETTVAEHTFALLLALTRKIVRSYERTVRGDFSIEGLRGMDLHGKTFGCVGTGKIGQRVLAIAAGFGMELLAFDVRPQAELARQIGFAYVSMDELLSRSHVISLHVPYSRQTHHMIDAKAIAKMPRGTILVNTSRGGVVDPQALIDGLTSGQLYGAALDVLEGETAIAEEAEILSSAYDVETLRTIVRNHALLRMPNVIITPHVAFNSQEAVHKILQTTTENIHAFLEGRPQNVVSAQAAKAA